MKLKLRKLSIVLVALVVLLTAGCSAKTRPPSTDYGAGGVYHDDQHGFKINFTSEWKNHKTTSEGWTASNGESGPGVRFRKATNEVKVTGIVVRIFTVQQWNALQNNEFTVKGAQPRLELRARNAKYVFLLDWGATLTGISDTVDVENMIHNTRAFQVASMGVIPEEGAEEIVREALKEYPYSLDSAFPILDIRRNADTQYAGQDCYSYTAVENGNENNCLVTKETGVVYRFNPSKNKYGMLCPGVPLIYQ